MINQNYEGVIPDAHFFDPEGMSVKDKSEFETWHAEQVRRGGVFNLRREMEAYCVSDVKLLKGGCQKFQEEFYAETEFNPMEPNSVAVEPPRGWYGARSNQSHKALQWLARQEHQRRRQYFQENSMEELEGDEMMTAAYPDTPVAGVTGDFIRHARNGGEVRLVGRHLVDGYDRSTNTVYEFHGCLWHGCTSCFPNRAAKSKLNPDRTFAEVRETTRARRINCELPVIPSESSGNVNGIRWSKRMLDWRPFCQTLSFVPPLNPRDASFGGRTNAATLHYEADQTVGKQIRYMDVTSLYPTVNKYDVYPVGHPTVLTHPEDQDITTYFGLAKVDLLAPRGLYYPVLPHRTVGEIHLSTMPYLRGRGDAQTLVGANLRLYSRRHRAPLHRYVVTWWPELLEAVEQGYRVVKIHEVWHFPPNQRRRGLFA